MKGYSMSVSSIFTPSIVPQFGLKLHIDSRSFNDDTKLLALQQLVGNKQVQNKLVKPFTKAQQTIENFPELIIHIAEDHLSGEIVYGNGKYDSHYQIRSGRKNLIKPDIGTPTIFIMKLKSLLMMMLEDKTAWKTWATKTADQSFRLKTTSPEEELTKLLPANYQVEEKSLDLLAEKVVENNQSHFLNVLS